MMGAAIPAAAVLASEMTKSLKALALKHRLVLVEWEDSSQPVSAWQWVDDYQLPEIVKAVSVGFLIAQTKTAIAVAPNLGDTTKENCQASGIIRIPRSAVRRITNL
jgi:hypothetical protein